MKLVRFDELKLRGIVPNRTTHRRWVMEAGFPAPIPLGDNSAATDFDLVEPWVGVRQLVPALLATVKELLVAGAEISVDEIAANLLTKHPLPDAAPQPRRQHPLPLRALAPRRLQEQVQQGGEASGEGGDESLHS